MAAALEDTPVSYEDLAEIEREFDDIETEISMSLYFLFFSYCFMTLEVLGLGHFGGVKRATTLGLDLSRSFVRHSTDVHVYITYIHFDRRLVSLQHLPILYSYVNVVKYQSTNSLSVRQQVSLTQPLYLRRNKTISQIPNFWALVLEQAPPDIDQYIQPSDSALLLSSLTSLHVSHFELEDSQSDNGDPRSVSITWTFSPNEYFTDEKLVKKFWYRKSLGGWCGLVSEPVRVHWKKGKDLTGGLLDMVCDAWDAERKENSKSTLKHKTLEKKMNNTSMGGLSFFAWFGFIGRKVSEKESKEANAKDLAKREARKNGKKVVESDDDESEEDDEDDLGMKLEVFPDGDDLAIAITEDLWPGAIKYFSWSTL